MILAKLVLVPKGTNAKITSEAMHRRCLHNIHFDGSTLCTSYLNHRETKNLFEAELHYVKSLSVHFIDVNYLISM